MEIKSTTDYGMFSYFESNRVIDNAHARNLAESIRNNNYLELRPILVDGKMRVIDGQHRLEAAKQLGVPVWYQVTAKATEKEMVMLNANQRGWKPSDYVHFYASQGNEDYAYLEDFCEREQVNYAQGIGMTMLGGRMHGYGRTITVTVIMKTGKYAGLTREFGEDCARMLQEMRSWCRYPVDQKHGVLVLSAVQFFDRNRELWDALKEKQAISGKTLARQPSVKDYLRQFEDILNWNNKSAEKIRLS